MQVGFFVETKETNPKQLQGHKSGDLRQPDMKVVNICWNRTLAGIQMREKAKMRSLLDTKVLGHRSLPDQRSPGIVDSVVDLLRIVCPEALFHILLTKKLFSPWTCVSQVCLYHKHIFHLCR